MFKQLPPLKSLIAFAAAGQTLHFSKAAEQLNITQSAVSHQIKNLEKSLGCKLFYRQGNQLFLTEQGEQLLNTVTSAFTSIDDACKQIKGEITGALQFGVMSAFAVHRLTALLGEFGERNQGLDLRLRMLSCDDNASQLELDILLLDKPLEHIAYQCEKLKCESYYPVATPELAEILENCPPQRWHEHTRLIDLQDIDGWPVWFAHNQINLPKFDSLRFGNTLLMLKAVQCAQGIALLGETLIAEQLQTGSLVKLSQHPMQFDNDGYYFCIHQKRLKDPNVRAVRNWLASLLL